MVIATKNQHERSVLIFSERYEICSGNDIATENQHERSVLIFWSVTQLTTFAENEDEGAKNQHEGA